MSNQKRQLTKARNLIRRYAPHLATTENTAQAENTPTETENLEDLLRIPGMSQYLLNIYLKGETG